MEEVTEELAIRLCGLACSNINSFTALRNTLTALASFMNFTTLLFDTMSPSGYQKKYNESSRTTLNQI